MGTTITFNRADGKPTSGYLAKAARANASGVIVVQEWWGLQDQIKGLCDRFAAAGYEALAPDLYDGVVAPYHDTNIANNKMAALNILDAVDHIVRGAAQYLKLSAPKVGLTGFCLGGLITAVGAARVPEISAAVSFYGLPSPDMTKPADVKVPLQGHFANQDDWCTPKAAKDFEAGMKAAGQTPEFFFYDAKHGFMNEQRLDFHHRAANELAWDRTIGFWRKHL